jgi:hypothetical protein
MDDELKSEKSFLVERNARGAAAIVIMGGPLW